MRQDELIRLCEIAENLVVQACYQHLALVESEKQESADKFHEDVLVPTINLRDSLKRELTR